MLDEVVGLGFRALGFPGLGFGGLGFRGLGFTGLGFPGLGFGVEPRFVAKCSNKNQSRDDLSEIQASWSKIGAAPLALRRTQAKPTNPCEALQGAITSPLQTLTTYDNDMLQNVIQHNPRERPREHT